MNVPVPQMTFTKHHCLINTYFNSVFTTCTKSTPSTNESLDSDVRHHLVSIDLAEEDTYNALISLDLHKATGIDGIGPQLLKNCAPLLYGPLNFLFNLTLRNTQYHWNGVHTVLFQYLNLVTEDQFQTTAPYHFM